MIAAPEPGLPGLNGQPTALLRTSVAAGWGRAFVAIVLLAVSTTVVVDFRVVLTVLTLGAFLAAIIGVRHPVIGLLGIGVLCTLDMMSQPLLLSGGLWRWNTLNYWLLGVVILFLPLLIRRLDLRMRLLLLLLACLGVELLMSADVANGVQHIFGAFILFGMLVYFLRAARFRDAWYWLAVVSGVTATSASLAFLLQESRLPEVNPNIWSHVPVMGTLSICLAFAATPLTRRRQLFLAGLAAMNAGMVFLSGSRGNLAIVLIALLAIALMTPSLSQNLTVLIATLLLGIGVISQFPALESRTIGRLKIMLDPHETARRRTSGRFDLALGGWYIFRAHPMGVGTGSFPTYWAQLGRREGMSEFEAGTRFSAHAGWVKVLAENGVPGTLLLSAFVSSFAVSGWRRRVWRLRVLGGTVTAVIAFGLLSTEFQSKSLWFLAAGATILLAQHRVPHRRRRRVPKLRHRRMPAREASA